MNRIYKIYIAGKITGLSNYQDKFNRAERMLAALGHKVMNPSILPDTFPWEAYMPICYAMIDACDSIYLLDNWTDSKGANLEHEYALKKGKVIIFEERLPIIMTRRTEI